MNISHNGDTQAKGALIQELEGQVRLLKAELKAAREQLQASEEARGEQASRLEVHVAELQASREEIEVQAEELEAQLEELRESNEELKAMSDALRDSEEMFHKLADSANTGILLVQDEDIIYVNKTFAFIGGYTTDEVMRLKYWDVAPPEMRDYHRFMGNLRQRSGGRGPARGEVRAIRKDGAEIWLDCTWAVLTYKGKLTVLLMAVDTTQRKRALEELKEARAQAELYLDLMSHDLSNMHQVAQGYLELAREMLLATGQEEILDKPIEVLQRSARLINNVRKLQKLHDGLFRTERVDLAKVLLDVKREFEATPGKAIRMDIGTAGSCKVLANELLHDVFSNLVSNALKHSGDHAGEIRVSLESVAEQGRLYYRVSVEDNGSGISDDFKDKVFKRLLKGTTHAKGMGLGLYLVKSLVDSYRGRVWVEDKVPGDYTQGAKFVVLLPAIE